MIITFERDLSDILGFDETVFKEKKIYKATSPLSLTRRIKFLYIYSNICDMLHVGDTKAPLLAVLPFHPKTDETLSTYMFKHPMYVPLRSNRISQIDIGIYDGVGKPIPFKDGSTTLVRLHFRKVQ